MYCRKNAHIQHVIMLVIFSDIHPQDKPRRGLLHIQCKTTAPLLISTMTGLRQCAVNDKMGTYHQMDSYAIIHSSPA